MLGCKPCSCPASKLEKEPRDSNRDINQLLDKGSYKSAAKDPGVTPHRERQRAGRTWQESSLRAGEKGPPFKGGTDVSLAHQLPGKPAPGAGGKHVGSY